MPRGGRENKAKRKEKVTEAEREKGRKGGKERERLFAAAVQRHSRGRERRGRGTRGWQRVNSGEILLVSVNDGPWSALVSWRRRGFSRASPVPDGGGGK